MGNGLIEQNGTENTLIPKQRRAAVLVAEDTLSDVEIAKKIGVGRTTLHTWKSLPEFKDAVAEHAAELERQLMRLAIARKGDRVKILDDMQSKILHVITARSTQYPNVPGADAGILVGQLKQVKHLSIKDDEGTQSWTEEQWEYSADTGLMRELRATQEQAAKELGQWSEKRELTGAEGGAIAVQLIEIVAPPDEPSTPDGDD